MSSIPGNNLMRCLPAILLLAAFAPASPGAQVAATMTSNDIYHLDPRADTLWMTTSGGVNMTVLPTDTTQPLSWWGWRTPWPWALAGGTGVFFAAVERDRYVLGAPGSGAITAQESGFEHAVTSGEHAFPWSAAWDGDRVWVAWGDGGLVTIGEAPLRRSAVLVPGLDKEVFGPGSFAGLGDELFRADLRTRIGTEYWGDGFGTARPFGVAVVHADTDSGRVLVLCPQRLWTLTTRDTLWDTLTTQMQDSDLSLVRYTGLWARPDGGEVIVTAALTRDDGSPDTVALRLRDGDNAWETLHRADPRRGPVSSVAFGPDSLVYLADAERIYLYELGNQPRMIRDDYKGRLTWAADEIGDALGLEVRDIAVSLRAQGEPWRFWLATPEGLFYEPYETADRSTDLGLERLAPPVAAGLSQTYAWPGILTTGWSGQNRTRFAYNLTRNARVTIRVYDYNMDLVKTVTDNQMREAGSSRRSGRSEREEDSWDGTNMNGRTVAPGVYYYKITASTGERAFGKIIVALQR